MIKCGRLASKNATARLTTTRTNTIGYIGMYVRVIGTYAVSEKRVHRAHLEARVSRDSKFGRVEQRWPQLIDVVNRHRRDRRQVDL